MHDEGLVKRAMKDSEGVCMYCIGGKCHEVLGKQKDVKRSSDEAKRLGYKDCMVAWY